LLKRREKIIKTLHGTDIKKIPALFALTKYREEKGEEFRFNKNGVWDQKPIE